MSKPTFPAGYQFEGFDTAHFIQVPARDIDYLLARLTGAEFKVLYYILRRTLGFNKTADTISRRQIRQGITKRNGEVLDEGTGLSDRAIRLALDSLVEKGIIQRVRRRSAEKGHQANLYRLPLKNRPASPRNGHKRHAPMRKKYPGPPVTSTQGHGAQSTQEQQTDKQKTEEQQNVVAALTSRKIHQKVAQKLTSAFSPDTIRQKIEMHDWLLKHNPAQLARNAAGWLVRAIEDDYAPPRGFKTQKQEAREVAERVRQNAASLKAREAQKQNGPRARAKRQYGIDEATMKVWDKTLGVLRLQMTRAAFETWLGGSLLLSVSDGVATIGARNTYARDWLEHRLATTVGRALSQMLKREVEIKYTVLNGHHTPVQYGERSPLPAPARSVPPPPTKVAV